MSHYNQLETVQIGVLLFLFLRWICKTSDLKSRHPAALESKSQWTGTINKQQKYASFYCKVALGCSVKMSSISIPPAKDNAYHYVYILLLFVFIYFFLDNGYSLFYSKNFFFYLRINHLLLETNRCISLSVSNARGAALCGIKLSSAWWLCVFLAPFRELKHWEKQTYGVEGGLLDFLNTCSHMIVQVIITTVWAEKMQLVLHM